MLENSLDKYYYIDSSDKEWQFTEINGTLNKYYFKCSTFKYSAFSKINLNDNKKEFSLTRGHNIQYYNHSYFRNTICIKKIIQH